MNSITNSFINNAIDRIRQNRLWDFPGGVFPAQHKSLSNQFEIADISLPSEFYIPVKQHIGIEGRLLVAVGDKVLKGQALTHSTNPFAVPVHAPSSGEIAAIEDHVSAKPSGIQEKTIVLKPDELEKWVDLTPLQHYKTLPKTQVVEHLCDTGIAGLGGAGFPTHIKLGSDKSISCLIINGVECEPYITSDDRLMREHAWQIRQGIDVLMHLLEPEYVILAIEDNKPEAIQAMHVACQDNEHYLVCSIPTKYPAGGEKQLIEILTGQQVPIGQLPVDMGIIMQNVGTCFAIADAVFSGKPLIQRVVTLTGKALSQPKNVWGLLGTPIKHLLKEAGYQPKAQKQPRIIMGGPMMGFTVASDDVPIIKISNCILAPSDQELPLPEQEIPCIRCGACADACPASLLPQQLYWHSKAHELDKAQEFNIADCIECGACAFVCPSNIPLVHYYRQTKADIRIADEQKQKSDKSKARFNSRQERLDREKAEREEKRKQSAQARERSRSKEKPAAHIDKSSEASQKATTSQSSDDTNKSSKVAAAIARAKAKKAAAAQENNAKNEPQESTTGSAAEATAETKTPAIEAPSLSKETVQKPTQSTESSTKDRVAAAIARAKARKEQQAKAASTSESETKSNQPKIEKPIEKPVHRTVEPAPNSTSKSASETSLNSSSTQPEEDPEVARRKRVDAAIAKAKARQKERIKANAPKPGEQ